MSRNDCKIYVGGLPRDASERELEKAFSYYGRLKNVWVARQPPGFAFLEYEDGRDAEDAIRGLDGTTLCGVRIKVEAARVDRPRGRGGRGGRDDDRCYSCGRHGHFAYECERRRRSRSRSRGRRDSRSRSRSRGRARGRRSRSSSRSDH